MIRGQPRGGPPQERTLAFSNVSAPRLARRPNPNSENPSETKDEVSSLNNWPNIMAHVMSIKTVLSLF